MKILSGLGPQGGLVGLLILGDGLQGHLQTVERNHIPGLQGAQGRILAVDLDAALGADVADGPAAVIVPGETAWLLEMVGRSMTISLRLFRPMTFSQWVMGS